MRRKNTKIPINAVTGSNAKSNDAKTWSSFSTALASLNRSSYNGLGFFFAPPFVGVDIDDVEEEISRFKVGDDTNNIVSEFVKNINSYTEISQSGKGIHIIFVGNIPDGKNRCGNVEMYSTGRFFALTGQVLQGYDELNTVRDNVVQSLHNKYLGSSKKSKIVNPAGCKPERINSEPVNDIINRILASSQKKRFLCFFHGNWEYFDKYPSQSEADLAFAGLLGFWCKYDFNKMDIIFRRSKMYRPKYDEMRGSATYGENLHNHIILNRSCAITEFIVRRDDNK